MGVELRVFSYLRLMMMGVELYDCVFLSSLDDYGSIHDTDLLTMERGVIFGFVDKKETKVGGFAHRITLPHQK
jgi:hypothetical protein